MYSDQFHVNYEVIGDHLAPWRGIISLKEWFGNVLHTHFRKLFFGLPKGCINIGFVQLIERVVPFVNFIPNLNLFLLQLNDDTNHSH